MARLGAVTLLPSINTGKPRIPTRPPQVRLPTSGPELEFAEHPGQKVASGASRLVNNHDFGTEDGSIRSANRLAKASRPVTHQRSAQQLDVIVGHLPATVEPLIDDDGRLVGLWEKVALEVRVSGTRRVGYVDIGDSPLEFARSTKMKVSLNPGSIAERSLIRNRFDDNGCAPVSRPLSVQP